MLTAQPPDGHSSDFAPLTEAPRAPLEAGWYHRADQAVPIYIWVFSEKQLSDDPGALDLRRRGFTLYVAHSACTLSAGECAYASAEDMETWTPIAAPDPGIVDADRYGGPLPGYRTPAAERLPPGAPRTVGVLDIDYARVAGRRLPEYWDVDVVGFMVMERQESDTMPGQEAWHRAAFHTYRDRNLSDLNTAADDVDLIIGHNLFDGDYRCLRTYGALVDIDRLVAKTVDTLYLARHLVTAGTPRAANLDLTALARAQGLRERAKKASRTEAHHGIRTTHDAEDRWFFQPVSDDCELTLELWHELLASRRLRTLVTQSETAEYRLAEDELRLLLEPQLTPETFTNQLTTTGTVYELRGAARNESVARIHREIEQRKASRAPANPHPPAAHRQRCLAPGDAGELQCDQLIPAVEMYCRAHRAKRRCRGNPALDDACATIAHGSLAHCRWHRMTALYVPRGQRLFEDFTLHLPLPGWGMASDWGYDTGTRSFFARLYRSGQDPSAPPAVWLAGAQPELANVVDLADALQEATGQPRWRVVAALTADRMSPQERAATTQDWEPAECISSCPCGSSGCGHGEPCPSDECTGHDTHVMRNPRTATDVTAWQDHFDCCEGAAAASSTSCCPTGPGARYRTTARSSCMPG